MHDRQRFFDCCGSAADQRGPQPWPSFKRMEAQTAFVTKPALINVDVAAPDRPVDSSFAGRVAGNAASDRASRMVDSQVASCAATAADRVRPLQEPCASLEAKVRT